MLHASITVEDKENLLEKLFMNEENEIQGGRAKYILKIKDGKAHFEITAKDAVALRAMLNAIAKTLTVHEKTGEFTE